MSDKQKFAFDKVNFILLAIGMAIVSDCYYRLSIDDGTYIVRNLF